MPHPCLLQGSTVSLDMVGDSLHAEVKKSATAGNMVQLLSDGVFANPGGGILGSNIADNSTTLYNDEAVRNFLAEVFTLGPNAFAWPINALVIVTYEDAQVDVGAPAEWANFTFGQTVFVETLAGVVTPAGSASDFKSTTVYLDNDTRNNMQFGGSACVKAFRLEPGGYARITSFRSIAREPFGANPSGYFFTPRGKSTQVLTSA